MRTRAIVAVLAVGVLLGLAVVLQHWLFGEDASLAGTATAMATTDTAAGTTGAGAARTSGAASGAGGTGTGSPADPAAAAAGAPVVTEVSGKVERKRPGGAWEAVAVGAVLAEDDEIRTAAGARAMLAIDRARVEVFERDHLTVADITTVAAEILLRKGRIAATVPEGGAGGDGAGRALRVRAEGSDAVVETRGGRFAVYADGAGTVAVAADTPGVTLSASGKTLILDAATVARVTPGAAPIVGPVAASVVLEVRWPEAHKIAKHEATVSGRTVPGGRVRIGDTEVAAGADGTFRATVPLAEGPNRLKVDVEDVTGKRATSTSPSIVVDTKSPHAEAHPGDLWKKK